MDVKFDLGRTVITPNALEKLDADDVQDALRRHHAGDWGDCCDEDRQENDFSLNRRLRLFSVFHDRHGTKFWVITEAELRSVIIKAQHNCQSDPKVYARMEDPPIRHEYCTVFKKPVTIDHFR